MLGVEEIIEATRRLRKDAPPVPPADLPPGKNTLGAPEWHRHERAAWELGERVRQLLVGPPKLKRSAALVEALVAVVECRSLRRGRQSFLFSLSFVGAAPLAPRVAPFLKDKDVSGHALSALIGMRAPGYAAEVAPLLEDEQAWIGKLARKYLDRYPAKI